METDHPPFLAPPLPPPPSGRASREPVARRRMALTLALLVAVGAVGGAVTVATTTGHGPYSFLRTQSDGTPTRWDPCAEIRYIVNLDGAPQGALDDVQEAIRRVSAASGLRFGYGGETTWTASMQFGRLFQGYAPGVRWNPVLITWVDDDGFSALQGGSRTTGELAFAHPEVGDGVDYRRFVSGVIVIDTSQDLHTGFGDRFAEGPVLMHELGHIVGLGHVGSGDELMWSPLVPGATEFPSISQTDFGDGDREGLKLLGPNGAGCPN